MTYSMPFQRGSQKPMTWMRYKGLLVIVGSLVVLGCAPERQYHDSKLNVTVVSLDPELNNRWGTSGVVVSEVANGSGLSVGDLVTHVVSRTPVTDEASLQSALKKALGPRRHWWNLDKEEPSDASAVLEIERGGQLLYVEVATRKPSEWNKLGLQVNGTHVSSVNDGYEHLGSHSPAESAGIQIGDQIRAVIDEDAVPSIRRFRNAVALASDADSVYVYTHELTGIRLEAIRVLGELGGTNPLVLDRLVRIVREATDPATRRTAAQALESLADSQTEPTLLTAILPFLSADQENDSEIRRSAAAILETLVQRLPKETFDDAAIVTLVAALRDPVPSVQFKAGVILSLLGERSVEALVVALSPDNPDRVRDIAATALGDIGNAKSRDALIAALRETPHVPLQLTIATALSKIGDTASRAELQALLQRTNASGVREFVRQLMTASPQQVAATPK